GLDVLHTYGPTLSGAAAWAGTYLAQEEFPFWVGLFLIGCLVGKNLPAILEQYRWWPLALLVTLIAGWLTLLEGSHVGGSTWQQGTGAYFWPSRLPFTCTLTLLVLWLGRAFADQLAQVQGAIDVLGQHSLGIYILQPLPLVLLGPATGGWAGLPRLLVLLVATLGFGTLAVLAWARPRRDLREVWRATRERRSSSSLA
ncbi:MAG: acyltransferase family protein, partial [Chloroflexota bacterium]